MRVCSKIFIALPLLLILNACKPLKTNHKTDYFVCKQNIYLTDGKTLVSTNFFLLKKTLEQNQIVEEKFTKNISSTVLNNKVLSKKNDYIKTTDLVYKSMTQTDTTIIKYVDKDFNKWNIQSNTIGDLHYIASAELKDSLIFEKGINNNYRGEAINLVEKLYKKMTKSKFKKELENIQNSK